MSTVTFHVSGMHCSSCSMLVTMNLEELPGVQGVDCDHATGRTSVTYDDSTIDRASITNAIADTGHHAEIIE